jgi:flagellar hook-associated protein 2
MSLGGLSGLASGVDTSGIVDQLIDLERQANARLGRRKVAVQARQTGLKDIAAKLAALKSAAQELNSATTWAPKQTLESSDPTRVAVTLLGGAGIGGTTIGVDRLAASAQRGYDWTPNAQAGTLELHYDDDDQTSKVTVDVKANATAADVAAAINAKGGAPVFASVIADPVNGEERLVLSARKTGRDSGFVVNAAGLQAGQLTEDGTYERSGQALDAAYRVNGSATTLYSQTNTVDNAIPGVRLTLKGVTAAPASVTVGAPAVDHEVVKTKVKAFVDAYNAVVTTTRGKLSEKSVADASTSADAAKGQLFGDTGLLSMLSSLRSRMGERLVGDVNDLADIGIAVPKASGATSQDAKDGKLAIDDAKLTAALNADSSKVRDLFTSFGAGLDAYIRKQTGGTGVLDSRQKSADGEIRRIADQVTRAEERLAAKEKRLKAQFAAMESALLNAQSQGSWLAGQLAALSR